ncbi:MAG: hypothetical protein QHC90_28055 [Shinella sp.]|nr:hypothetical protein [Shinella sp.]
MFASRLPFLRQLTVFASMVVATDVHAQAAATLTKEEAIELLSLAVKCPIKPWARSVTGTNTEMITAHSLSSSTDRFSLSTQEDEISFSPVAGVEGKGDAGTRVSIEFAYRDIGKINIQEISDTFALEHPKTEVLIQCKSRRKCITRSFAPIGEGSQWKDREERTEKLAKVGIRLCDAAVAADAKDSLESLAQ